MSEDRLAVIAEALGSRREVLEAELAALTAAPATGANVSFGKRIGDGTTEAVERIATTATARSIAASIADIDGALAGIASGTYGTCAGCGSEIPAERLEARPATIRCVTCAASS